MSDKKRKRQSVKCSLYRGLRLMLKYWLIVVLVALIFVAMPVGKYLAYMVTPEEAGSVGYFSLTTRFDSNEEDVYLDGNRENPNSLKNKSQIGKQIVEVLSSEGYLVNDVIPAYKEEIKKSISASEIKEGLSIVESSGIVSIKYQAKEKAAVEFLLNKIKSDFPVKLQSIIGVDKANFVVVEEVVVENIQVSLTKTAVKVIALGVGAIIICYVGFTIFAYFSNKVLFADELLKYGKPIVAGLEEDEEAENE